MKEGIIMEKRLNLKFKGERNYLHGTDILNDVCTWLTAKDHDVKDIDFAFHRLATKQLKVLVGTLPDGIEPVAVCAYKTNGVRHKAYMIETDQPVIESYPYLEDEIVKHMEIDVTTRQGVLRGEVTYSDIEVWVAMTKALHQKVFANLNGKWLFVRGRFPEYTHRTAATEHAMGITASFNDKLTRSDALLNGVKVGEIYFSIV